MNQNPVRAIILKLGSVVAFVVMSALIKYTAPVVPAGQQVFFRSFFALPVIMIWLQMRGQSTRVLRTQRPMSHVYRGLIGTTGMALGFLATGMLPLPELTALSYATPVLIVIFAAMFLGERLRAFRLIAVAVGLIGVMIVLSPRLQATSDGLTTRETLGAALALMGAAFSALAQVYVRRFVQVEPAATIVFWFTMTSTILSLATVPLGWVVPSPITALLLVLIGICGGLGQILMTSAFRNADASLVAPFDYASMLLAIAIGYGFFGEVPTRTTLIGAAIVIAAGVAIIWRERRLGIRRLREGRAPPPV